MVSAAETYARIHKTSKPVADLVRQQGYFFHACVVDTFGNWCASGRQILQIVSSALSARDGRPAGLHLRHLLRQCSVSLMLSNARALLHTEDPALTIDDALPADGQWDPRDDEPATAQQPQQTAAGSQGPNDGSP